VSNGVSDGEKKVMCLLQMMTGEHNIKETSKHTKPNFV
jgi:hypothetical protein